MGCLLADMHGHLLVPNSSRVEAMHPQRRSNREGQGIDHDHAPDSVGSAEAVAHRCTVTACVLLLEASILAHDAITRACRIPL